MATIWTTSQINIPEGGKITVSPNLFKNDNGIPIPLPGQRPILPITIEAVNDPIGNVISIGHRIYMTTINFSEITSVREMSFNNYAAFSFEGSTLSITLGVTNINELKCTYKINDTYQFIFSHSLKVTVLFIRFNDVNPRDTCSSSNLAAVLKKNGILNNIVPSIFIDFQSLIDGSDIGNTVFEITDKFQYYNHKTTPIVPGHVCQVIRSDNYKITIFDKACPLIVNVLQGIGETAWQKVQYLFENNETNFSDIYDFFILGIVKYSMTKYLLSRIMYGNFNIKYVLNKYNNRLLRDLNNTRFCNFVDLFTNPNSDIFGYEQYFL
jgi:hypothetical protein